jgi:tRNA-splicing ligase RtcB (3'-phosphate/5'-hydroxy nucleic acid ligase)
MKKLKIRAKELKRIGLNDQKLIRLACALAESNYRRDEKPTVMGLLEELLFDPNKFAGHEHFAPLVTALTEHTKATKISKPKKFRMKAEADDFAIYGREHIDQETLHQMYTAMKLPIAVRGALMADAHLGYGLPIGGVVAAYNAVMPYGVGMDIACRMCMSVFPDPPQIIESKREFLVNILIDNTRFGLAQFNDIGNHELMERREFRESPFLKTLQKKFYEQLGTSGHGNHFVDLGYLIVEKHTDELGLAPGEYFAILSHSGSRNFGSEIAKHYTAIAQKKLGLTGEGARLAWLDLDSVEGQEYWQAMTLAGDYAAANHRIIHEKLSNALGSKPLKMIENHHNYAWKEQLPDGNSLIIHRKGATPAGIGDVGIIPGNMVSPAFVVSGKGNNDSLNSASHGAGRLLSRRKAKAELSMETLKIILKKHKVELIGGAPDESPNAYKDIHQVMEAQKELVNILALFYPKIVRME